MISDTHGLVRPQVHSVLEGVEIILHAGDVGGDEVLRELRLIAPVLPVYGNTDFSDDPQLAPARVVAIDGVSIHVSHGHEVGSPTPAKLLERYQEHVIVYGHTHRQLVARVGERLVVNPGAAGPKRFELRPTVAILTISDGRPDVRIIELEGRI